MAYHETFWVAVAAASPVIALANTVAITDASGTWFEARVRRPSPGAKFLFATIIVAAIVNFLVQVGSLIASLVSLYVRKDSAPGYLMILYSIFGPSVLLTIVLINVILRFGLRLDGAEESRANQNTTQVKQAFAEKIDIQSGLGWPETKPVPSSQEESS